MRRFGNFVGFAVCVGMLGFAYYLQFVRHLVPCPLCIFERIATAVVAVIFLLAFLQHPRKWGRFVYLFLIVVFTAVGVGISARHLWIQHLPPGQIPVCGGATLNMMIQHLPPGEVIRQVLTGSGECHKINWTFWGLSLPGWVLVAFVLLGLGGTWANSRR